MWLEFGVAVVQASSCSSDSNPSLGTSICLGSGPKKKKKRERQRGKKERKKPKHTTRNIANLIILLSLLPRALETKSKLLGKALMGGSCPPSSCLPTPASGSSFSHPEVCAGWVWNAAPHPLQPAVHSTLRTLRTRVTGVP